MERNANKVLGWLAPQITELQELQDAYWTRLAAVREAIAAALDSTSLTATQIAKRVDMRHGGIQQWERSAVRGEQYQEYLEDIAQLLGGNKEW